MNFFIGNFEDQIYLGTFSWWFKYAISNNLDIFFNPYLGLYGSFYEILNSSQPFLWYPFAFLYAILPQTIAYSLVIFAILVFNVLSSVYYFNKIKKNLLLSLIFGIYFGISPYVILHTGRHIDLMNVGFFPILLYLINTYFVQSDTNDSHRKGLVRLFFLIYIQSLVSNYYGIFMILISVSLIIIFSIQKWIFHKEVYLTKQRILNWIIFYFSLGISLFLSLISYFNTLLTPVKSADISPAYTRTVEDFANFSAKPWTFVIPPTNHLIYGEFAKTVLDNLKIFFNNYYWFNNYFVFEHGGNYLGWIVLILVFASLIYKNWFLPKQKGLIVVCLGLSVILFILSMPPFLTINGTVIYLPSYLIFKYFGIFRSLNRLSVPISLALLSCAYIFTSSFYERTKSLLRYIFVLIICIFMLLDLLVPLKIQSVFNVPEQYVYLSSVENNSKIVFYPSDRRDIFWLNSFKKIFVNPKGYISNSFNADLFTSEIIKKDGFYKLKNIGANYLVISRSRISDFEYNIFNELSLVKETSEVFIFKINNEKIFEAKKISKN